MNIGQFDICTTFLHQNLNEKIYMVQPEGLVSAGEKLKVCHLLKGSYGVKQSSKVWNCKLNDFLTQFNLDPIKVHLCMYLTKETPPKIHTKFQKVQLQ